MRRVHVQMGRVEGWGGGGGGGGEREGWPAMEGAFKDERLYLGQRREWRMLILNRRF